MNDTLFLKWHLGLGDAIICNGLVRVLAERHNRVIIPAKPHNLATVQWMFSDDRRITVIEVPGDAGMIRWEREWPTIALGLWSPRGLHMKEWDQQFYDDASVPFECRWSEFSLPGFPNKTGRVTAHCAFLHEDRKRGFHIDRRAINLEGIGVYEPISKLPFWTHLAPLEMCEQYHVIDSCFLCLIDSVNLNDKRRVLHAYATRSDPTKRTGPPTLRHRWEILE